MKPTKTLSLKSYFIILFLGITLNAFTQNQAPVANPDAYSFGYGEAHYTDTIRLPFWEFKYNDSDPNFTDQLEIDSLLYSGPNHLWVKNSYYIYLILSPSYQGTDTLRYILKDNGSPVLADTGLVFITIRKKDYALLDANTINAYIHCDELFSSPNYQEPGFEAPANSNSFPLFNANLWVTGEHQGLVHSNVKMFNHVWNYDHPGNMGPISPFTQNRYLNNTRWDQVWKISQHEIDFHINNWMNSNYEPPKSLVNWPAHGDTLRGEPYCVAPFYDYNQDGNYNPLDGDYPKIKGDQSIYFIYNDGKSPTSKNPMDAEVHGMAYAFSCQDSALQNTVFVDYKIINRSTRTFSNTHIGMFTEGGVGNPTDDRVQCDVNRGLYYFFNGDDYDDHSFWLSGYGYHPPSIAIMTLQGSKQKADGIDNILGLGPNETVNGTGIGDGIIDNEHWGMQYFRSFWGDNAHLGYPTIDSHFHYFLTGKFLDGRTFDYGGSGSPSGLNPTNVKARYYYPGTSDIYNYGTYGTPMPEWTEVTAQMSAFDKRGVSSTGPSTFKPNDTIELTYAFVFGRDYLNTGAQAGVDNMLKRADSIRSYFDQGLLTPCGFPTAVNENQLDKSSFSIYPNPTKDVLFINQSQSSEVSITIFDVTGKVLFQSQFNNPQIQVSTKHLPKGMYLLQITHPDGQEVKPFIKE